jgi:selenocysteine-specific elongation factor
MTMRSLILGTAGHIDHGKTALVRALTGVDTDRLKEEKERGITVDLGFAELVLPESDLRFGVVDVPGHDGFIKNMLAGATGMDLVLLVVAADEGIMPQTREHLAIVQLLGVPRLVVAVAKSDLVEEEWLDLVVEEIREALSGTPYPDAPVVPVSSVTRTGLEELMAILSTVGSLAEEKEAADLARLPVDRVFTMKGAGTVVTGTLWTGRLRIGDRVKVLPGDQEARVRSLQLHGQEVSDAKAGGRVAVGLAGGGISRQALSRGQTLVEGEGWAPSWMLTCHLGVLPDTGWEIQQGQRVRVHLGTAEVLARAALLDGERLGPGDEGWVQLRLEGPLLARARDHLVVRSYSPVTTIAGGRVAEVLPVKRRRLGRGEDSLLESLVEDDPDRGLEALLSVGGWGGVAVPCLPHLLGHPPGTIGSTVGRMRGEGRCQQVEDRLFARTVWEEGRATMARALATYHGERPLKPGMPLEELRQSLPGGSGPGLAEAILRVLVEDGTVRVDRGLSALAGFSPELNETQEESREYVRRTLKAAGLAVPGLSELAAGAGTSLEEIEEILRLMGAQEEVLALDGGLFFHRDTVRAAGACVVDALGGRAALGPADFREVLGVTRKYLLPILRYLDTMGITTRIGEKRSVAEELPKGWGT